jgi:hypothetical protein
MERHLDIMRRVNRGVATVFTNIYQILVVPISEKKIFVLLEKEPKTASFL